MEIGQSLKKPPYYLCHNLCNVKSYQVIFDWLDTSVICRTIRGVTLPSPIPVMEIQLNDIAHKAILHCTLWLWAPFCLSHAPILISNMSPNSGLAQRDTVFKKKKRKAKDNPGEVDLNSVKLCELCVSSLQVV